jgi:DNA-binding LacI/PurR family transcriptional regulator
MQDIANDLNVSKQLVSYALNGTGTVSKQTRQLIVTRAEELGYRRNASAANLKSERSGWLTLLNANAGPFGAFDVSLLKGVDSELSKHNLHLHFESVTVEAMYDEAMWPRVLREWMSDGIIIVYSKMDVPELEKVIHRQRIPAIWTNARRESDCVFPDDEGAFYAATEELLRLGHRRIFYISDGHPLHYSTHDRQAGYEKAMLKAGLAPEVGRLGGETPRERFEFIRSVVARPAQQRPTAIVCYSRQDALSFGLAARTLGISIPEELSLVAEHEYAGGLIEGKWLSGMAVPFRDVGSSAVRLLLQKIADPQQKLSPQAVPFPALKGETHAAAR